MTDVTRYLTLAHDGSTQTEVKRSRFICDVARVDDERDARALVERARRRYWDARHHCSAFVLGPDAAVQRSSDDGEPSGTAGAPMLDVLRGTGVSDVAAVVTRYFGGVLLGTGGLARAYADAVRVALDAVGLVERRLMAVLDVTVSHADAGRVESDLRGAGVRVLGVEYAARVILHIAVPPPAVDGVESRLAQLTTGAARVHEAGSRWVDAGAPGGAD